MLRSRKGKSYFDPMFLGLIEISSKLNVGKQGEMESYEMSVRPCSVQEK